MELIDNINRLLGDDLKRTLQPGARLKVAAGGPPSGRCGGKSEVSEQLLHGDSLMSLKERRKRLSLQRKPTKFRRWFCCHRSLTAGANYAN
jgi:hypothetical protein